jgi:hypothetical protein
MFFVLSTGMFGFTHQTPSRRAYGVEEVTKCKQGKIIVAFLKIVVSYLLTILRS